MKPTITLPVTGSSGQGSSSHQLSSCLLPPIGKPVLALSRKRGRDPSDGPHDETFSQPSKITRYQHVYETPIPQLPRTFLQHRLCLREMIKIVKERLYNNLSHDDCRRRLVEARESVEERLQAEDSSIQTSPWTEIPLTLGRLLSIFQLQPPEIQSRVSCPFCCALSPLRTPAPSASKPSPTCSHHRFYSQTSLVLGRKPCQSPLYKQQSKQGLLRPIRIFYYQSLRSWLGKMLLYLNFETELDASLRNQPPPNGRMNDVWDGRMWKSFEKSSTIFTATSGNLVFGFYCDWFNPDGKASGKKISAGVMLLVCFNLPPTLRYKSENIFIFGIIPGPGEPSLSEVNHFLEPLVDEMKDFWEGIYFSSTSRYPKGRLIHAAVWPLLADIPAMKKIAGFTSHDSTNFCSLCAITRTLFHSATPVSAEFRDDATHQKQAHEWKSATSAGEEVKLAKSNGVRYSIFSELPYWKPVSFVTIDIMHNILLGLLKDLACAFLDIPSAGSALERQKESLALRNQQYNELVPPPQPPPPTTAPEPGPSQPVAPAPSQSHHSYNTRSSNSNLHRIGKSDSASSNGSVQTIKEKKRILLLPCQRAQLQPLQFPASHLMSWICFNTAFLKLLHHLG